MAKTTLQAATDNSNLLPALLDSVPFSQNEKEGRHKPTFLLLGSLTEQSENLNDEHAEPAPQPHK